VNRRHFLRSAAAAGVVGPLPTTRPAAAQSDGDEGAYAPLGRLDLESAYEAVAGDDAETAYVAIGDGYATVDLADPAEPRVLATRTGLLADDEEGPMALVWDAAVDGDRLLVAGPAHRRSGIVDAAVLVDVSDSADPERVTAYRTGFPVHNCTLVDGYAYLTGNDGDRNPVVILDVGGDEPVEAGRWSVLDHDPAWGNVSGSLRPIHDLSVRNGTLYAAYWDAGTHVVDVADPASPERIGGVEPYTPGELSGLDRNAANREARGPPGNHHYAATNDDGSLLAINVESWGIETSDGYDGGPGGVELYDLADPSDPTHLATIEPPETPEPTPGGVWTTSHNFELRGDRLYTSWYEGGVKLHDVSDPANPERLAWWRDPADASFWTARAGVPGEFFLASSTSHRPAEAALYTFPDRTGEQADPPPMEAALDGGDGSSHSHGTPTATGTATPTGPSTETSASGFGLGAGAAALGGAAWLLRRSRRG